MAILIFFWDQSHKKCFYETSLLLWRPVSLIWDRLPVNLYVCKFKDDQYFASYYHFDDEYHDIDKDNHNDDSGRDCVDLWDARVGSAGQEEHQGGEI